MSKDHPGRKFGRRSRFDSENPGVKRGRPFGVNVLLILELLTILVVVLIDLNLLNRIQLNIQTLTLILSQDRFTTLFVQGVEGLINAMPLPILRAYWLSVTSLLVIGLRLVIVFGLWRMRRWAWALLMVQVGVIMVFDLWSYLGGTPPYLSMVVSVVMVFYLNQREVQQAFWRRGSRVEGVVG